MNTRQYRPLDTKQIYIDKTAELEKGIEAFPSLYIQGVAAGGKTIAVKMLLARHPEVEYTLCRLGVSQEEFLQTLRQELPRLQEQMSKQETWLILEDLNAVLSSEICSELKTFIRTMPEKGRVIFVGRECSPELLDLLWKREMEMIGQEVLVFTRNEIREYGDVLQTSLKAEDVFILTEGWPGCVDLLFRMDIRNAAKKGMEELIASHEIQAYIDGELLGSLSEKERRLASMTAVCPWFTEELCHYVWGMEEAGAVIDGLYKKGILRYNKYRKYYTLPNFLKREPSETEFKDMIRLAQWYLKKRHLKEAVLCVKKTGNLSLYREILLKYYDRIPFLGIYYGEVLQWEEQCPEFSYLRAMFYYSHQSFGKMKEEMTKIEKWIPSDETEEHRKREIYLNLAYCNPEESFVHWMTLLEKESEAKVRYRLYSMLGYGYSFLCGLRDLSQLYACSRKEEARMEQLWKNVFGEAEWLGYCLARLDFYMETKQKDRLREEDLRMLDFVIGKRYEEEWNSYYIESFWNYRQAGMYLLCKWTELERTDQSFQYIHQLKEELLSEDNVSKMRNTEAVVSFYSIWRDESEQIDQWMRDFRENPTTIITESNYMEMLQRAKGCLLFEQYEKAEAVLDLLAPYLQNYHRYRYYAECLFCKAILEAETDKRGQAIRHVMESLLVTGNSRYVNFYTRYGKKGRGILETYVEWYQNTVPGEWHRKKKYNYGNVLRMPVADYLEVLVRGAKKEYKMSLEPKDNTDAERLTMMETLVLHSISRGLTNTQICEEQNLKLPTVKSHIYSLYKKLGVSSRVQAVNRGKELGLVR